MHLKKFKIPAKKVGASRDLPSSDPVWIEIDSKAIKKNFQEIKKTVGPKVFVMGMVKANAYGHGIKGVSKLFEEAGADYLGVNNLTEALSLREEGIDLPILILNEVNKKDLELVVKNNFEFVGYNLDYLKELDSIAADLDKKIKIHLKIDTGMGRMGINLDQINDLIKLIPKLKFSKIAGIMTHFAASDDLKKRSYFQSQLQQFQEILFEFQKADLNVPLRHTANSAATLLYPESHFDLVRIGLTLYGLWPSYDVSKKRSKDIKLTPVLSLKTKIVQIKTVKKGNCIGYGCTFKAPNDIKIAILPIGYAEGYGRALSNQAEVLINGKRAPVRGRVSMNLTVVEIDRIPEAKVGDEVIVIGKQGKEEITVDDLAKISETINYEIVTRLSESLPRVVI
ncbi:alanine racemase [Patescibacteria group bacterium]